MRINISATRAKEYSSHNALILKIIPHVKRPVLELGAGPFSTPLLHWLCKNLNLELYTYENNKDFYYFASKFESRSHRIRLTKNFDDIENRNWGLVLIDHSPVRGYSRGSDALKFKDKADFIVLHDTGPVIEEKYGYEKIWLQFKYKYVWTDGQPWTTVVSNFTKLDFL